MSLPAILKGFLDKVMLRGFAYKSGKYGIKGLLPIKLAKLIRILVELGLRKRNGFIIV